MKKYRVIFLEQYEVEIEAANLVNAHFVAQGAIAPSGGSRKITEIRETPAPFEEERACPDCVARKNKGQPQI